MDTRADDTPTEDRLKADVEICQLEERKWKKRRIRSEEALITLQNRRCDDVDSKE
jgi:hypothetical protein